MILYEGRNVLWKDRECVVIRRIIRDRVLIAYASNPRVQRIVKVADLEKMPRGVNFGGSKQQKKRR